MILPTIFGNLHFGAPGFFVFRTPLLPVEDFLSWGKDLGAARSIDSGELEKSLATDRALLRERLRLLLARPEIREAIFLASSGLEGRISSWERAPDQGDGPSLELALVKYFTRMTTRPTPFGMFAGYSQGTVGSNTALVLDARTEYRRRSRLDMEYLCALADAITSSRQWRPHLKYRPNNSLYRIGNRIRYIESRFRERRRTHHLVAVEYSPALDATLNRAAAGATHDELAYALLGPGVSASDASGFVSALVGCRLLVSELEPVLTGPDAGDGIIESLSATGMAPQAACLSEVYAELRAIDDTVFVHDLERYQQVAARLAELPVSSEMRNLFQVDLRKPAPQASLGESTVKQILHAVSLMHRLTPRRIDHLEDFRDRFVARYEAREVPLVEALDEEIGIGFNTVQALINDPSPLLEELKFPGNPMEDTIKWTKRDQVLLDRLQPCWGSGDKVLDLGDADIEALATPSPQPMPGAFAVMATLIGDRAAVGKDGEWRIHIHSVTGPSGVRVMGRFCQGDEKLETAVREHLAAEEAIRPEAIFAEVVCQPQDRVGNVLSRPVLRGFEIPYLGRSGAAPEQQIPVSDLFVSVIGDRVVLRSARHGREVIPRISNAHYFSDASNPGLYRFLGALQSQGTIGSIGWSWGGLDNMPFLPRVVSGRIILSRAQWRISRQDMEVLVKHAGAARYVAVQELRAERGIPRWVAVVEDDNELVLDLENVICVDNLMRFGHHAVVLAEWLLEPEMMAVTGPEGSYVHEIMVPFVGAMPERAVQPAENPARKVVSTSVQSACVRTYAPGSEWLYAKFYGGVASADSVLQRVVAPLVRSAQVAGHVDRWFFIRYQDPEPHLRVRFHGDRQALCASVLPRLNELATVAMAEKLMYRIDLGTYEREIERYGSGMGIELAERLFHADSEAVLAVVESFSGDSGQEYRWRLAYYGMDRLLNDFGLDLAARLEFTTRMRDVFAGEFRADSRLRQSIGTRLRQRRPALQALLEGGESVRRGPMAVSLEAFDQRSQELYTVAGEIRAWSSRGDMAFDRLLKSYIHMFVNRIIRSSPLAHEYVLYDLLSSHYRALAARQQPARSVCYG
jgi:thiopeptide-type bacteriocin biosynthesis protein